MKNLFKYIFKGDICKLKVDCIVNPTNEKMINIEDSISCMKIFY